MAFCPLGIDYCSQCKHGIGSAQRGAAEVRRLQRLTAIDAKTTSVTKGGQTATQEQIAPLHQQLVNACHKTGTKKKVGTKPDVASELDQVEAEDKWSTNC